MSDSKYFFRDSYGEGAPLFNRYSDTIYQEDLDSTAFKYELSKDYLIISTEGEPYGTTRAVIKGNYIFNGYELIGGVILGAATIVPEYAQTLIIRLKEPLNFSFPTVNLLGQIPSGNIDRLGSMGEYAKFFPAGWSENPLDGNLVSIEEGSSGSESSSGAVIYSLNKNYDPSTIVNSILGSSSGQTILSVEPANHSLSITASTWSGTVNINYVIKATDAGGKIEAKQINFGSGEIAGSVISGGNGNDDIKGYAGWDIIDGGAGDDLIHGGNGRDILTGGTGRDELHGDFGWNTFKSEKDGVSDLIAVKSDHYLVNWLYGKAGNSPNGEKSDIIEGLDPVDKIRIIGVDTSEITFAANISAKGVTGIGIYGKGILEALYTGSDLTVAQITQMTSGDASAAAMSNLVNSYGVW